MAYDVFISHAKEDERPADDARGALESNGFRCWIAPRDIDPGEEWGDEIIKAIKNSRAMLVVLSSSAKRLDLSETDLSGAYFTRRGRGVHFEGIRLRGACLDNALLGGGKFRCAYLSGASVRDIDVTNTDFYGADLSNLTGAPKEYIASLIRQASNLNAPPCAQDR